MSVGSSGGGVGSVGGSGSTSNGGGEGGSSGAGGSHSNKGGNDGMDGISIANRTTNATIKQQKKVCFICGSQTTFTINIYEPRSGPNIVDVINLKFKVQPLNEDKFLCYSCNNWLINWYSIQNKSATVSGSNSNNSGGGGSKTTTTTTSKDQKTKSKINQNQEDKDDDDHNAPMDSDSYFNGCDQTLELRKKLHKHLYVPKTVRPSDGFISDKVTNKKRKKSRRLLMRQFAHQAKCNLCSIPLSLHSSNGGDGNRHLFAVERQRRHRMATCSLRFCRMCKRALAQYYFEEQQNATAVIKQIERPHDTTVVQSTSSSSHQLKLVNPYVLSRLKKLGTTVVRERCASKNDANDLVSASAASSTAKTTQPLPAVTSSTTITTTTKPSSFLLRKNAFFIDDRPDEIRSSTSSMYAAQHSGGRRNEKNEIILAFDRTVTEVFQAATMTGDKEKGCGGGFACDNDDDDNNEPHDMEDVKVINDIYKRIPKSLSITLLVAS